MGVGLAIGMDAMRACKATPWWGRLWLRWRGASPLAANFLAASPREENIASVARFTERLGDLFRDQWRWNRTRVGLPDTAVRMRLLFTDSVPADPKECRRYLLWRLADILDVKPEYTRLAYQVLPSPLPGSRQAVLCAVSAEKVIQQYERALAEGRMRYTRLAPSAILHFNLFHRHLTGPPGRPILLLAASGTAATTVITLEGCPIFWRTRRLTGTVSGDLPDWRGELLRDASQAIGYVGDELGIGPPSRLLVTAPLAEDTELPAWLGTRLGLATATLDAAAFVQPVSRRLKGEVWTRWEAALGAAAHAPPSSGS